MNEQIEVKEKFNNKIFIIQIGILLVLMGFMYRNIIPTLVMLWYKNEAYSHAFLIPVIIGYFIWTEKEKLLNTSVKKSKFGLSVLVAAVLVYIAGRIGAERFVSSFSMILLIGGLIYYHLGGEFFKVLSFPWLLLFFTIPIPNIIYNNASFQLQLFSSDFAVNFMQLFNIPVYNEGNVIHLFYTNLEVAEACSGIRSIISLITLSVVFSYYFQKNIWVRLILIFSAIPIAVLTNSLRVAGTGMIAHFWSIKYAQGFFHEFSGWLIFIAAFMMLLTENFLIDKFRNKVLKKRNENN